MKRAFTIVELVVVAAIFGTAVVAFFGAAAISFKAIAKASDKVQAAFLMEEGLEGVRYLRDLSWKKFIDKEQLGYEQCFYFDTSGSPPKNLFATSTPEIVGQWHLDEAAGATSFEDRSNFGNNSQVCTNCPDVGSGIPSANTGLQTAANFTGASNDEIKILNSSALSSGGPLSVEFWFNAPSSVLPLTGTVQYSLLSKGKFAGFDSDYGFALWRFDLWGANGLYFYIKGKSPALAVPSAQFTADRWYHIVGTWDGAIAKIYKDKILVAQSTPSGTQLATTYDLYIGRNSDGTAPAYFTGIIDEIAIYNRALTATEVLDRYNGHAVCPTVIAADDNSQTFKRTVKFENVCRDNSSGGIMGYTTGTTCPGGQIAYNKTKKATVKIIWGPAREFVESADMYISDLFLR